MSAFCVFGMTLPAAQKMAETRFDKAWDRMPRSERNEFTKEAQAAWVQAEAEKIMAEGGVRQVSPPLRRPRLRQRLDRPCQADRWRTALPRDVSWRQARQTRQPRDQQNHQEAGAGLGALRRRDVRAQ